MIPNYSKIVFQFIISGCYPYHIGLLSVQVFVAYFLNRYFVYLKKEIFYFSNSHFYSNDIMIYYISSKLLNTDIDIVTMFYTTLLAR